MEGAMRFQTAILIAALLAGCGSSVKAEQDTGEDTATDTGEDGVVDVPDDGETDAQPDVEADAVVDPVVDGTPDTTADTVVDVAVADPVEEEPPCDPTAWFTFASTDTPRAIPDDYDPGITSSITVPECPVDVGDLEVTVDIRHTYRGDLHLILESPAGDEFVLHDGTGGSEDDIRTTYPTTTAPARSTCLSLPTGGAGTWTLTVIDDSPVDTGTLDSWSLRLRQDAGYCPETYYTSTDGFPMAIPDDSVMGVDSRITVPAHGSITDVAVLVEISHEYIGDVFVTLESPSGTDVLLYDRAGDWDDEDLFVLFPMDMAPVDSLGAFSGEDMYGTWTLQVSDLEAVYSGTLDGWRLHVQ